MCHPRRKSRGFTLLEILLVLLVLGIVAAIEVPQFTRAATNSAVSTTMRRVENVCNRIEVFTVHCVNRILP